MICQEVYKRKILENLWSKQAVNMWVYIITSIINIYFKIKLPLNIELCYFILEWKESETHIGGVWIDLL